MAGLRKFFEALNEILLVSALVINYAEAEHGDGTGEEKKKQAIAAATAALKDSLVWITESWAQVLLGLVINVIVWLLNKKPEWKEKAKDFFGVVEALAG